MKSHVLLAAVVSLSMAACHVSSGEAPVAVDRLEVEHQEASVKPKAETEVTAQDETPIETTPVRKEPAEPEPESQASDPEPKVSPQRVFGWREWVWVVNPGNLLRAKLDTGAKTCSIHAVNVEPLEIDGKKWVKFTICDPENKSRVNYHHKAPVLRIAKVKNDTGGLDTRYVVPLTFQIGGQKLETEFNLNNRSHMVCEVLIGRNALSELGLVDSSRTDLVGKPAAPAQNPKEAPAKK